MNGSNRVGKLSLAALMILGFNGLGSFALIETGSTKTAPEPRVEVSSTVVYAGDDNNDGIVDEDESGWDCWTMGNKICGPGL